MSPLSTLALTPDTTLTFPRFNRGGVGDLLDRFWGAFQGTFAAPFGGAAAAAFVPTDIADLRLWVESDMGTFQDRTGAGATTPADDNGEPVGTWQDQSGSGAHLIQITDDSYRPTLVTGGTLPVVRFDGVDNWLKATVSTAQPYTLFVVVQLLARTGLATIFDSTAIFAWDKGEMRVNDSDTTKWDIYGGAFLTQTLPNDTTNLHLYTTVFNGASSLVRDNGVQFATGNVGAGEGTEFEIGAQGAGRYANVDFGAVLLYGGALAAGDITSVETYLNGRHGVY